MRKTTKTLAERIYEVLIKKGGVASLKEIYNEIPDQKEEYIRCSIYRNLESYTGTRKSKKPKFKRVSDKGKGIYMAIDTETNVTALVIEGDGRKLDMIADESVDAIVTDHPWLDEKAHKSGNQKNFTDGYENTCFHYTEEDIKEKYRVLKNGSFCVEILPRKNGTNAKYLRKIEEMFEKQGFEFYAECQWVKGELKLVKLADGTYAETLTTMKANTGRTVKDCETVLFFTKGKARNLRPDKIKIKKVFNQFAKEDKIVKELLKELLDESSFKKVKDNDFTQTKIKELKFTKFSTILNKGLKNKNLKPKYCMSGTKHILPSRFIYPPVKPKDKIHQAEKPVELLEAIVEAITTEGEVVLDQFAGSGNLGKACLNKGRISILIELLKENVEKIVKRLGAINITQILNMEDEEEKLIDIKDVDCVIDKSLVDLNVSEDKNNQLKFAF